MELIFVKPHVDHVTLIYIHIYDNNEYFKRSTWRQFPAKVTTMSTNTRNFIKKSFLILTYANTSILYFKIFYKLYSLHIMNLYVSA